MVNKDTYVWTTCLREAERPGLEQLVATCKSNVQTITPLADSNAAIERRSAVAEIPRDILCEVKSRLEPMSSVDIGLSTC